MFNIRKWFTSPELSSFNTACTREDLIQQGRIIIIDDESPLLIEELRKEGFAVDHDTSGNDLHNIEKQIYDIAIIDYHGVGHRLGDGQGLELLKHVKRVSPRTRIIAYTSRSLTAAESEFFRLSHSVLQKDLGLVDSLTLIEAELMKAFSKEHLFEALLAKINITHGDERERLKGCLVTALAKRNESVFRTAIKKIAGEVGLKTVEVIIKRLLIPVP